MRSRENASKPVVTTCGGHLAGRARDVRCGAGSCGGSPRYPLAEFDYTLQPAPSIPFIDTTKERSDMWLLKRYGLPFMYWNLILKGRA